MSTAVATISGTDIYARLTGRGHGSASPGSGHPGRSTEGGDCRQHGRPQLPVYQGHEGRRQP